MPEWIRTSERLPEARGYYLGYFPAAPAPFNVAAVAFHGNHFRTMDTGQMVTRWIEMTHWRKMPKGPEEEEHV